MVNGWATQSIAITALLLRTATDVKAVIGVAILAALILESQSGINIYQLANISPMRAGAAGPWSFAYCATQNIWQSRAVGSSFHWRHDNWGLNWRNALALWLLITSSTLQFTSTILLSDLKSGELAATASSRYVMPDLSYDSGTSSIPRDSAWSTNPFGFPVFGEYHESMQSPEEGILDTGLLLRAVLPYSTAEDLQTVALYSGNAMLLDARASCQAPQITHLMGVWSNASIQSLSGLVSPSQSFIALITVKEKPFNCFVGSPQDFTVCQVSNNASPEAS